MTEPDGPADPGVTADVPAPADPPEPVGVIARQRQRLLAHKDRAEAEFAARRERHHLVELGVKLFERDRDSFGSVLGSAIAMRLFLFTASLSVAAVGLVNLVTRGKGMGGVLGGAGVTGQVATQVESATSGSTSRYITLLLTGLVLSASAGRSLTAVLAATSARAWGLEARGAKATMRTAARVTALVALLVLAASLLNRIRASFGVAVGSTSLAANALGVGIGWFFVCLALPRASRDPGSVLPGAAVFGISMTLVQAFMQWYLPGRIASASAVMGTIGFTVAVLGYLFLIGRLMALSLAVSAVAWEELGSLSEAAFALPVLRRLPERFPKLAAFFDLPPQDTAPEQPPPPHPTP
jgi:hypothetical protein